MSNHARAKVLISVEKKSNTGQNNPANFTVQLISASDYDNVF